MLEQLISIVREAGRLIPADAHAELAVTEKSGPRDLVTKYDALVQQHLQTRLLALLPQAGFMGEEGFHAENWRAYEWLFIVDPIDGTTNFIQGIPNSSVSVGLMHDGRIEYGVVYNPFTDELYSASLGGGAYRNGKRLHAPDRPLSHSLLLFGSAVYYPELIQTTLRLFNRCFPLVQDVRRFGSAALDLCELAAGRAGAFFECRLCPWDYAAGSLIAQEAGVRVTKLDGGSLNFFAKDSLLAGTPLCWEQLYHLFAQEETT